MQSHIPLRSSHAHTQKSSHMELLKKEINQLLDELDKYEEMLEVTFELAKHIERIKKISLEAGLELSNDEKTTQQLLIKLRKCDAALYDSKVKKTSVSTRTPSEYAG